MYFPSKKDFWFDLIFWAAIITCLLPLVDGDYIAICFTLPVAILLIWIWFSTGYKINGDLLIIRCGPFTKKISITEISKIRETNTLLASFALSMDRLEITYGTKFGMAIVSPVDKEEFVASLKNINPRIIADKDLN